MKNKALVIKYQGYTASEILESGRLLDEKAAAFCLDCSVSTLQRDRHINIENPRFPYIKQGRSVRYEPEVIKSIINKNRVGFL